MTMFRRCSGGFGSSASNVAPRFAGYSVGKLATYRVWDTVGFSKPEMRVYQVQPGVVHTDMEYEDHG